MINDQIQFNWFLILNDDKAAAAAAKNAISKLNSLSGWKMSFDAR